MPPRHLYIHVPFCGRRCVYCDFAIAVRRETPTAEYLDALRAELGSEAKRMEVSAGSDRWILDTVYVGGGTPSRLGPAGITDLLMIVRDNATITSDAEVTLEANPEDVTELAAAAWLAAGVNRVSLGAQSFDDRVLEWMHRSHSGADVERAIGVLRSSGLPSYSLDLIFALPSSLQRSWSRDLDRAIALDPPHVSAYGLTVEPGTPLARTVSSGRTRTADENTYAEDFLLADERFTSAGYSHYEVSNYSKPGRNARHNSAYWSGAEYLGVGPSAHSFVGGARRWNVRGYDEWKRKLAARASVTEGSETLTPESRELESIYLGLRSDRGYEVSGAQADRVARWIGAGWGVQNGNRVTLNANGWLRLDSLAADLAGTPAGRNYISSYGSTPA